MDSELAQEKIDRLNRVKAKVMTMLAEDLAGEISAADLRGGLEWIEQAIDETIYNKITQCEEIIDREERAKQYAHERSESTY